MGILNGTREYAKTLERSTESKFDVNFDEDELVLYVEYRAYLVNECEFKKDSASSYVTNHKRATCKLAGVIEGAVTSDENSSIKKFDEFEAWRAAGAEGEIELVEDDAETIG